MNKQAKPMTTTASPYSMVKPTTDRSVASTSNGAVISSMGGQKGGQSAAAAAKAKPNTM